MATPSYAEVKQLRLETGNPNLSFLEAEQILKSRAGGAPAITPPAAPLAKPVAKPAAKPVAKPATPPIAATVPPIAAPAAPKPQVILPTDLTRTPMDRRPTIPFGLPIVVQPETTTMKPRLPMTTSTQEVAGKARDALETAKAAVDQDKTLTPEAKTKQKADLEALYRAPRDVSGEVSRTPTPSTVKEIVGGKTGALLGALAPQTLVTPEEAKAQSDIDVEAGKAAFQYKKDHPELFAGLTNEETAKRIAAIKYMYKTGQPLQGYGAMTPESLLSTLTTGAFTTKTPAGTIVESPLVTAGKLLNVPEAALVTAGKTALQAAKGEELTPLKSLESELKGGTGLQGAGEEIGTSAGKAMNAVSEARVKGIEDKAKSEGRELTPDEQAKIKAEREAQKVVSNYSSDIGGFAGFIGSMLVPADLGLVSTGATGARTAKGAVEIATAFKPEMTLLEKAGVAGKGFVSGSLEGAWDAWKLSPRTAGNATLSRQLEASTAQMLENPEFKNVSKTTLEFAANPKVADILSADKRAAEAYLRDPANFQYNPEATKSALKAEFESGAHPEFATFEDFQEAAQKYGIDAKRLPGERVLMESEVPQNVLSKEAEAAKERVGGTGPRRTSSLEDIAISGRRSDLYYTAMLDEVKDDVKAALLEGAPIKKTDLYPAIDAYMNKVRDAGGDVVAAADSITSSLSKRGIEIGDRAYGGAKRSSVGSARFILPQDAAAKAALDKAYRIDVTRNFLNNFTKETGITGIQAKIGGATVSATDAKKILEKVKSGEKGAVLDAIRERLKTSGGKEVEVLPQEAEVLKDYFVRQFQTQIGGPSVKPLQPTEMYSPEMVSGVMSRLEGPFVQKISPQDFNQLIRSSIAIESSPFISAKSEAKLFEIGTSLTREGKIAAYNDFVRNVYKPKDFTESALGASISNATKAALYKAPEAQSSITRGMVAEINGRFSMLPERFKLQMREKIKFYKGNKPEAFSAVMIEEFTTGVVHPRDVSGIATREAFPVDIEAGAREMFRTNFASMFGAYERTGDILSSTSGIKQVGKASRITVEEMRDLTTVMMSVPGIESKYVEPFVSAVKAGEHTQAINILQRMHADYFGYSIEQILTRKAGIPQSGIVKALDDAAKKAASDISYGAAFESATSSGRTGVRSPIKAYEAASSQGMRFIPENFKELLVANYYSKSQTNIINDVVIKAGEKYPALFPSDALIGRLAKDDFEVTRSALINSIDKSVQPQATLYRVADTGTNVRSALLAIGTDKDVKELMQSAIKDSIKKESLSSVLSEAPASSEYVNTMTNIITEKLKSLRGTDILSSEDTKLIADMKKELNRLVGNLSTPPGSTYIESFGSMLNPELTEATMANNLARLSDSLKSPYSSSIQGAVDRMMAIPSFAESVSGVRGEVIKGANIKSLTDTLDAIEISASAGKLDEALTKGGAKMTKDIVNLEDIVKSEVGSSVTSSMAELSRLKVKAAAEGWRVPVGQRVVEYVGNKVGSVFGSIENFAKGGMLAGVYGPNMVYLAGNIITGPSIVMSTLGLKQGFNAAKGIFDLDTWNILGSIYAPGSVLAKERLLFTAPDGMVYTTSMMRDYVINGALGKSQASAELTSSLINGAIDWAGKHNLLSAGIEGTVSKSSVIQFLRKNFSNINDVNAFGTFANMCDTQYRLGVFKRALEAGESLDAASKLARESLFDYGKLSDLEKNTVSKVFWFWNFRRNNDRTLITSFLMDPRSTKAAFASGRGWSYAYNMAVTDWKGTDKMDQRYAMKDYSESRAFLSLVEDPENKRRYALYGPMIPSVSAVSDLVDYLSIPLGYVGGKIDLSPDMTIGEAGSRLGTLVVQQSNPLIQSGLVAASIGFDIGSGRELGGYLDPKLMWYVRKNESVSGVFDTLVVTEPVPKEEEKPWLGYYQGRQWRIPKNDKQSMKNWSALKTALTLAAVNRTAADASPAAELMYPVGEGYLPEIQISTGDRWTDIWRAAGVISATDAPLLAEARLSAQRAAASELGEVSKLGLAPKERTVPQVLTPPGPDATPEQIKEYNRKMNIK